MKSKMKADFDRRHRVKELPDLRPGQPVWLKTPRNEEAVVVPKRSVDIQTSSGFNTRRNRSHLRVRDSSKVVPVPSLPKDTNHLPSLGKPDNSVEPESLPDIDFSEKTQVNSEPMVKTTRSGRVVKPRDVLNM